MRDSRGGASGRAKSERRSTLAALCAAVAMTGSLAAVGADAQIVTSAGIGYVDWRESTSPLTVREQGALLDLRIRYDPPKERGVRGVYGGSFYWGQANYQGSYLYDRTVPALAVSQYIGTMQEGQVRYRATPVIEGVVGVVADLWRRRLGSRQKEDFRVLWIRLGADHGTPGVGGWRVGGGLKAPVWVEENAHFNDIGFDQNPRMAPGRRLSGYAEVDYRLNLNWTLVGQWDSYRFGRSPERTVTVDGNAARVSQPATRMHTFGLRLEYRVSRPRPAVTP